MSTQILWFATRGAGVVSLLLLFFRARADGGIVALAEQRQHALAKLGELGGRALAAKPSRNFKSRSEFRRTAISDPGRKRRYPPSRPLMALKSTASRGRKR